MDDESSGTEVPRRSSSVLRNKPPHRHRDSLPNERRDSCETTPLLPSSSRPRKNGALDTVRDCDAALGSSRAISNNPHVLLIPFFIYCMAMGAVAVPKLNVILGLMCMQYNRGIEPAELQRRELCNTIAIQKKVGQFMMFAHLISGLCCTLSSQRIGALSDRYGRRPLLAFTAIGLLFGDIISVLASWFPHQISVYWVLLEFAIGGLSGTFSATMALIQAFVVDCTEDRQRLTIFSRYHAAMFSGVAIGPVTGELFVMIFGNGNPLVVFYTAALCHSFFICFILLVLKESRPPCIAIGRNETEAGSPEWSGEQSQRPWYRLIQRVLQPCHLFQSIVRLPVNSTPGSLIRLAAIDGMVFGIQVGFPAALLLYAEYNFGWESLQANLFMSLTNSIRALALVFVLPLTLHLINKCALGTMTASGIGVHGAPAASTRMHSAVIQIALLFDIASHVGFALAGSTLSIMLWGVPASAGAVVSPVAQSLMSSSIARDRIGELFGTVSLIHALSRSVIPASMQLIYSSTVAWLPETIFFVLALMYGVAFLLSLRLRA